MPEYELLERQAQAALLQGVLETLQEEAEDTFDSIRLLGVNEEPYLHVKLTSAQLTPLFDHLIRIAPGVRFQLMRVDRDGWLELKLVCFKQQTTGPGAPTRSLFEEV